MLRSVCAIYMNMFHWENKNIYWMFPKKWLALWYIKKVCLSFHIEDFLIFILEKLFFSTIKKLFQGFWNKHLCLNVSLRFLFLHRKTTRINLQFVFNKESQIKLQQGLAFFSPHMLFSQGTRYFICELIFHFVFN